MVNKEWLFIIALGFSFVAVGHLIDFFLKKREARKLHDLFLKCATSLSDISLREWQIIIARSGIGFVMAIHQNFYIIICFIFNYFEKVKSVKLGYLGILLLLWGVIEAYRLTNIWFFGAIAFPFVILNISIMYQILVERTRLPEASNEIDLITTSSTFLSCGLSLIAIVVTTQLIPVSLENTHWYALIEGDLKPTFPLLLPFLNFPFDLITILVTIVLLRYLAEFGKLIGILAGVDLIISLVLSFLLYAVLLAVENNWDILHFPQYLVQAVAWFSKIALISWDFIRNEPLRVDLQTLRDIHLLPILLTTFVPVALYMSVFLCLSFCKPIMWLSARFFAVIGERDESVFKQFAILLATLMAAAKAIYDLLIFN